MTNFEKIIKSCNTPGKLAEMICDGVIAMDRPCNAMYDSGKCMQKKDPFEGLENFEEFDEKQCRKCVKCWLEREAEE